MVWIADQHTHELQLSAKPGRMLRPQETARAETCTRTAITATTKGHGAEALNSTHLRPLAPSGCSRRGRGTAVDNGARADATGQSAQSHLGSHGCHGRTTPHRL